LAGIDFSELLSFSNIPREISPVTRFIIVRDPDVGTQEL